MLNGGYLRLKTVLTTQSLIKAKPVANDVFLRILNKKALNYRDKACGNISKVAPHSLGHPQVYCTLCNK